MARRRGDHRHSCTASRAAGSAGPTKLALIHTGGEGKAAQNWLIHRMKDQTAGAKYHRGATGQAESEPAAAVESRANRSRRCSPRSGQWRFLEGDEDEWAFEMKWDGIRAIAYVEESGEIRLLSRNGNDVTRTYPDLIGPLGESVGPTSAVLDGEIVALNNAGQAGLRSAADTDEADQDRRTWRRRIARTRVQFMLFDILELGGHSLRRTRTTSVGARSRTWCPSTGPIHVPPAFEGDLEHAMDSSRELQLEGVLAKRRDSTYSVGRRSRAWIKIKHHRTQEVVIGGWRPGKGNRSHTIGSLLVGMPDGGRRCAMSAASAPASAKSNSRRWRAGSRRWPARRRRSSKCRARTPPTRTGSPRTSSVRWSSPSGPPPAACGSHRGADGAQTNRQTRSSKKHERRRFLALLRSLWQPLVPSSSRAEMLCKDRSCRREPSCRTPR